MHIEAPIRTAETTFGDLATGTTFVPFGEVKIAENLLVKVELIRGIKWAIRLSDGKSVNLPDSQAVDRVFAALVIKPDLSQDILVQYIRAIDEMLTETDDFTLHPTIPTQRNVRKWHNVQRCMLKCRI